MEDVRQGHHGIHRVNPRNNERRTDNDHYADETNSMISDARNPGGETSGILDTNDSMTQSINEKGILVGKSGRGLLEDDEEFFAGGPKQDNKDNSSNTVDDHAAGYAAHGTDSTTKERNLENKEKAKKEEKKVYPIEKRPLELCQITFKNKFEENKNNNNADTGSVISETGTLAANTEVSERENNSPEHRNEIDGKSAAGGGGQRRNSTPDQSQIRQNSANIQANAPVHSQTNTLNQVQTLNLPHNQPHNQLQNQPQNQPQNQQQPTNSLSNHASYNVEIKITFRGGFERKLKTEVEKTEKAIDIARELVSLGFISHNDTKQLSTIYNHAWQKAFGEITKDNGIGSTDVKDLIKENYLKMQRDQEKEIEKRVSEKIQAAKVGVVAK